MTAEQKREIARLIDAAIAELFKRPTKQLAPAPEAAIFTAATATTRPHQITYALNLKPGRRLPPVSLQCFDFPPHRFEPSRVKLAFSPDTNLDDVARCLEYYAVALSLDGAPLQTKPLYIADQLTASKPRRARSVIIGVTANPDARNARPRTLRRSERGRGATLNITLSGAIHRATKANSRPKKAAIKNSEEEARTQTPEPSQQPPAVD